jgi:hypothetical protein
MIKNTLVSTEVISTEEEIVNKLKFIKGRKVTFKDLSLYEWFYLFCTLYELPVRMTMITTALTLISMFLLHGAFHNPFTLLVLSVVLAFYLTMWIYTSLLAFIITIPLGIILVFIWFLKTLGFLRGLQ